MSNSSSSFEEYHSILFKRIMYVVLTYLHPFLQKSKPVREILVIIAYTGNGSCVETAHVQSCLSLHCSYKVGI